MPGATGSVSFEVSQKDVDRVRKKLQKASGKPLYQVMQRAALTAGDLLVPRIKALTPVGPGHDIDSGRASKPGFLRRSTRARLGRKQGRTALWVLIGPTAPHRHLVIRGTNPHAVYSKKGKRFGVLPDGNVRAFPFHHPGSRPNPYVDRAARGFEKKAADLVRKEWAAALR